MADNLIDTGKYNAIQAAIQEVKNIILELKQAENQGDANAVATKKAKIEEIKKKYGGHHSPFE